MWSAPLPYPCSTLEVSFVSDLHSKKTLLIYLPTTGYAFRILNLNVNAFLFLPQLTLRQTFSLETEGPPVARIEKSDLSTRAAAACLDACQKASQIPGLCKLNGCLSLDPNNGGTSELWWEWGAWWRDWKMGMKRKLLKWRTTFMSPSVYLNVKSKNITHLFVLNIMSLAHAMFVTLPQNRTRLSSLCFMYTREKDKYTDNPHSHSTTCLMTPLTLQYIPVMPFILFP